MLCQFTFKNFKSYKTETIFDLQATALSEFKETLISIDSAPQLLPISAIYGPNGGGKSNLLQALSCVISTIVKPVHELGKHRQSIVLQQTVDAVPFMFDDISSTEPTEFTLFFLIGNKLYRYAIALENNEVVSESLMRRSVTGKRPAVLFERKVNKITLGFSINKKSINTDINPKMPYLSFLAINYEIPEITKVITWFESCIIRNYANPEVEHQIMLNKHAEYKKQFISALNDMDIDITDYRYDENDQEFFVKRKVGKEEYELPFFDESEGTKKLIAVLPVILLALHEGRLVIIDELDAKLHPKLLRYVLALFKDKRINHLGAQLLFTSHDMSTMKNTVFRRDEIWFAYVNEMRESDVYSLQEIRNEDGTLIKNTAAYEKQYLEGRYGADPYLQNMLGEEFA